jgi:hypothetical protein
LRTRCTTCSISSGELRTAGIQSVSVWFENSLHSLLCIKVSYVLQAVSRSVSDLRTRPRTCSVSSGELRAAGSLSFGIRFEDSLQNLLCIKWWVMYFRQSVSVWFEDSLENLLCFKWWVTYCRKTVKAMTFLDQSR